jgi:predicted transcriptional regulator
VAIDDHPVEVLRRQLDLEDSSKMPFAEKILTALQSFPLKYPLDRWVDRLKEGIGADATNRIRLMVEICGDEIVRHDKVLRSLESRLNEHESRQRMEVASELLLDASRRAAVTRSIERVKRIGLILANGILPEKIDADEIEEMMRIAMELSDRDVSCLRDLVNLEGATLRTAKRIDRYNAHSTWEHGPWGANPDGELDSAFSKLESYGLVSRLAPPNNLNIMADFQNRYVLLQKGMRFANSISSKAAD